MPLCLDFLSVFEGEPYIVLAEDGDEIHQSAPEGGIEFVHQVGFCKGGKESFNRCPAELLAMDSIIDCIKPCLGCVEPFRQLIVAFFVFHLVECDMIVDSYESLLNIVMK